MRRCSAARSSTRPSRGCSRRRGSPSFGAGMLGTKAGLAAVEGWARSVATRVDGIYVAFDMDCLDGAEGWAVTYARARRPRPRDGRGGDPGPRGGDAGRRVRADRGHAGERRRAEDGRGRAAAVWPRRPSRPPEGGLRGSAGDGRRAAGSPAQVRAGRPPRAPGPVARPIAIRSGPACETTTTSSPASTSSRQAAATRAASSAARSPSGQSISVSPSASRRARSGVDARELIEGEALGDPEVGLAPAVVDRDARDPGRVGDGPRGRPRATRRARHDARAGRQGRGELACKVRRRRPAGGVERRVAPPAVPMPGPGGRGVPDQDDAGHVRPARTRRRAPRPSGPRSPPTRTSPSRRATGPRRR